MTSCIDHCDNAVPARLPSAPIKLAACYTLGNQQQPKFSRHFRRTEQARKPSSIDTARIHPWRRLGQLSISRAPILYELVACSLKHLSASISNHALTETS